jgi:hypothetical protein
MDLWLESLEGRTQAIIRDTYVLDTDVATSLLPGMFNFDYIRMGWPVLLDECVEFAKPRIQPYYVGDRMES